MADMSFLPEDYVEKRAQRHTNLLMLFLFLVVMTAVVAAFYVTDRKRSEIHMLQKQVSAKFDEQAERLEFLARLQRDKDQMVQKAKVSAILVERMPRGLLLSELVNNMPRELSLTALTLETKALKAKRPTGATAMEAARKSAKAATAKKTDEKEAPLEAPQTQVSLKLEGLAPTDDKVYAYMGALNERKLFEDDMKVAIEDASKDGQTRRKFTLTMRLSQELNLQQFEPMMVRRELKLNPMAEQVQFGNNPQTALPGGSGRLPARPALDRSNKTQKD
jgi:hypothetical protein